MTMKSVIGMVIVCGVSLGAVPLANAQDDTRKEAGSTLTLPIAPGPFKPDYESLEQYKYPDWFRDAKLGIWAHWGPQSVPMDGDWYARGMYEPGNGHYRYHLAHYGHPSEYGYKDIIPQWKAEKWSCLSRVEHLAS
jgi:Alpha-L-fucosidase